MIVFGSNKSEGSGSEVQIRKCFRVANNRGSGEKTTACVHVPVNNKYQGSISLSYVRRHTQLYL